MEEEPAIDEATMDAALALLHEADPEAAAAPEADAALARLEARAHAMGPLVDAALERADRRHARLTQLSADLVDALNLYHSLMRDALTARAYPAPPAPLAAAPPPQPPYLVHPPQVHPAHPAHAAHAFPPQPPRC